MQTQPPEQQNARDLLKRRILAHAEEYLGAIEDMAAFLRKPDLTLRNCIDYLNGLLDGQALGRLLDAPTSDATSQRPSAVKPVAQSCAKMSADERRQAAAEDAAEDAPEGATDLAPQDETEQKSRNLMDLLGRAHEDR